MNRRLLTVLAVGLLLRVVWVLYAGREPVGFAAGDPFAYLHYGRELAAGNGYRSFVTGEPTAFFPIGYPLFVALFAWLVQHGLLPDDLPRVVGVVQAVLGTLTIFLVWTIAARLFNQSVALVAATLVAFWPGLILLTASLNLETVFIALLMGALMVVTGGPADALPSTRRLLAAGTLLGWAALVRPFALPALAALFIGFRVSGHGVARAAKVTAIVAVPVVLVLLPWVARNQRELGTYALSTNMGDTLCLDHRVGASGRFAIPDECIAGYDGVPPADLEQERNRENTRRALRFVRDNPAAEAKLIVKRAWYMVGGDHDGLVAVESVGADRFVPDGVRTILRLVADWWYWVVLAVAVPGSVGFFRRGPARGQRVAVALTGAALLAIALELYGYTRFHVPLIPFQAMAAGVTLVWLADRHGRRTSRSATPPSAR